MDVSDNACFDFPKELVLGNYRNPFNPSTTIGFVQPEDGDLTLDVFDALGRLVDRLTKYGAKRGNRHSTGTPRAGRRASISTGSSSSPKAV